MNSIEHQQLTFTTPVDEFILPVEDHLPDSASVQVNIDAPDNFGPSVEMLDMPVDLLGSMASSDWMSALFQNESPLPLLYPEAIFGLGSNAFHHGWPFE